MRRVLAVAALVVALAGCGSGDDVRDYLSDTYDRQGSSGDTVTYTSGDGVGTVTAAIVGAANPAARSSDGGSEYLRYDDDIVVVSAGSTGSTIRIEDLDERYRSGAYTYLGNGFNPGSPAGGSSDGGPGDSK